jgi:hypothetical protein
MRNQSEERRPQKHADGVTNQVGNEPLPDSRWKQQKRSRKADGTHACEQTETENPQYRTTLTRCIHVLLVGSPFSRLCGHEEHGQRRTTGDVMRHAAHKEFLDEAPALRAHGE